MLRFFKSLFGKPTEPKAEAPYKVEALAAVDTFQPVPAFDVAPQPVKCGCGRSPSGFCVGLHKLTAEEWATHADNPAKTVVQEAVPAKKKPAARKPAAKKAADKKPAAMTATKKRPSKKTPV